MGEHLTRAVLDDPADEVTRWACADWLAEQGRDAEADWLRHVFPPQPLVHYGHGYGYGYGDGNGNGYGDGNGNGYGDGNSNGYGDGDGYGYGNGNGYGDGDGYGYGDGDGHGYGDGYGYGDGHGYGDGYGKLEVIMPKVGERQLIVLPHGWVICGYVAERIAPYCYRVERACVICRTGGMPWNRLAEGEGRGAAVFRPWGEVQIGPSFVMSRAWKGKLPFEE